MSAVLSADGGLLVKICWQLKCLNVAEQGSY